ncbi:MAG TPA: DUF4034 domain-containing protein [Chthoniobacter sp.]|nr:DUF4034 domain-containing protein [Chthoniobacter sp.]
MIRPFRPSLLVIPLLLASLLLSGCHRQTGDSSDEDDSSSARGQYSGPDKVREATEAFRYKTRGYYNSRNFKALEQSMEEIRAGSPLLPNGSWKIFQYYDSLECADYEKEPMWQLHDRIHKDWIAAYPKSITAHVAYADFLVAYGWQARGADWASKVTQEGWQLMGERLAAAHQVLATAKALEPQCPMWWRVEMRIALGQQWSHADFGKLYAEAKQVAPQFYYYDQGLSYYLLPRWYGKEGDWEKAAAAELQRPEGLGVEGYARVIIYQLGFYKNIFRESKASWPNARAGMEVLRKKYPQSLEIVAQYCKLACMAGDRPLAQSLFQLLNNHMDERVWNNRKQFDEFRAWAAGKNG